MKFALPGLQVKPLESSPPRGMWIEISVTVVFRMKSLSSPPRGMWIEIEVTVWKNPVTEVIPPTGDVD